MVALFPGHHGKDSGAIDKIDPEHNDKIYAIEAVLNAELTQKVKHILDIVGIPSKIFKGTLLERVANANYLNCELGISIHHNAYGNPYVNGYEVLCHKDSENGLTLAQRIVLNFNQLDILNGKKHGRGLYGRNDLYILNKTAFPVALIEVGFITNSLDEKWVMEEKYQGRTALAIVHAITDFIINN